MNRGEILDKAKELTCGDRNEQYGEPGPQLGLAGKLYRLWLEGGGDRYGDAHNEAVHQVFVKLSRMAHGEMGKLDTYLDAAAYIAIAGQVVNEEEEKEWKTVMTLQKTGELPKDLVKMPPDNSC